MSTRLVGVVFLVLVFLTAVSTSTFVIFELDGKTAKVSPLSYKEVSIQDSVSSLKTDVVGVNKIEQTSSEYIKNEVPEPIVREVVEETVVKKESGVQKDMTPFGGSYFGVHIFNSNTSVTVYPQYDSEWSSDYDSPSFCINGELFSVFSNQTGMISSKDTFVTKNFTNSSSSVSNPIGHDSEAVMKNSQLEVRKRVIVEPGETDYFQMVYTVKNVFSPYFRDINYFSGVNQVLKQKSRGYVYPAMVDLDGDGDLDLAVGTKGFLNYFENMGNNSVPRFVLKDDYQDISDSNVFSNVGVTWSNVPQFADMDDDGDYDLLFGISNSKEINYYENIGNRTNPAFAARNNTILQKINDYNINLSAAYKYDSFQVLDYDGDGDFDIMLKRNGQYNITYFENIGTLSTPDWQLSGLSFPQTGYSTIFDPLFFKYGADSTYDLLAGYSFSYTNQLFYENTGSVASPVWSPNNDFYISHEDEGWYIDYGSMNGAAVADVNGDGYQDLVVAAKDYLYLYTRKLSNDQTLKDVRVAQFVNNYINPKSQGGYVLYDPKEDMLALFGSYVIGSSDMYYYADKQSTRHGFVNGDGLSTGFVYNNSLNGLNFFNGSDYCVASGIEFGLGDLAPGEEKSVTLTVKFSTVASRGNADLTIGSEDIKFLSGNNISFIIHNYGNNSASNFKITLVEMDANDVVKTKEEVYNKTIKANSEADYSTIWSVGKGNTLMVILDTDNSVYETNEANNKAEKVNLRKNVYVKADIQPNILNSLFEQYVKEKINGANIVGSENDADYVIYVGNNPYNSQTLSSGWGYTEGLVKRGWSSGRSPYNGLVDIFKTGDGKKRIMIEGVTVDGLVAAAKRTDYTNLESNGDFVKKEDADAIEIFEWFRLSQNKPFLYQNNSQFYTIVEKSLYGKYSEEDKLVKTTGGTMLRLKHLGTMKSANLRAYENLPDYPVVLVTGLWSNIDSWKDYGIELADSGRDVWLGEITGGPYTEVDGYDYTYQQIIDEHVPAIIGGVVSYTNKSRMQYVGHSNGARSVIDSLSIYNAGMNPAGKYCTLSTCNQSSTGWTDSSFGQNPVETLVTLGVPGAFEGSSPVKTLLVSKGNKAITNIEERGKTHISIDELVLEGLFDLNKFSELDKISLNLFKQYFDWANSTVDTQPGLGLNLDNYMMLRGYGTSDTNDFVVTTEDATTIYNNINSSNKTYLKSAGSHTFPLNIASHSHTKETKSIVTKELNKNDLSEMQNCFNLIDPENKPWWCII